MPRFSIIVPVYNVEKYITKCLDSIMSQTFKDYEVIIVNDGTQDNSMELTQKYDVIRINQENKGLSEARNTGVKKAKGDYIIFLDSDDFIEKDLLKKINQSTNNNPDLIRYQVREIYEDSNDKKDYKEAPFYNKIGEEAFSLLSKYHYVENAWAYAIKREYYQKNKFEFKKGTIHEDFGLMPLVIIKAQCVNSIDYIGYSYLQRQGSIMNKNDYKKTIKKVDDLWKHYHYLCKEINKTNLNSKVFKSFISNSLIIKICELKGKEYKENKKKLKLEKVYNNLLTNTFSQKMKKILLMISPKLTIKIISR